MAAPNNQKNPPAGGKAPPPAFDPERPLLVQPWREFEGRGWLEVQRLGGSMTCTVRCKLLAALLTDEEKATGGDTYVGPQEAKDRIIRLGLWTPGQKGKKGKGGGTQVSSLPKRSLCKEDFKGSEQSLLSRARSVANNLGEETAAGRIGSLHLSRKGKDTFEKWWDGCGAARKARLLTDKKHFDTLTDDDKAKLDRVLVECPFRGEEPVPVQADEEDSKVQPQKKEQTKAKAGASRNGASSA